MSESTRNRVLSAALAIGLVSLVALTGLRKIRAPDYWFHLNNGRWIAENWAVPKVDYFTYTANGAYYLDCHWLFQLALYGVQSLAGHGGVVVAKALVLASLVAVLASIGWRRDRFFVTAFGLGLVLLAANDRFLTRPELTSFVFLAGILALLERDTRKTDAWLFAIIPIQLLWVNSHSLFAIGIVVCGIHLAGATLQSLRGRGNRRFWRLLALTVGVALCSFASPNFIDGALYPLQQLGTIAPAGSEPGVQFSIGEFIPIWQPGLPLGAFVPALLLAAISFLAVAANLRRNSRAIEHALLFAAFFGLFMIANRNSGLFAVVAGPLFVLNANEILDRHPRLLSPPSSAIASAVVVILLFTASYDITTGNFYARHRNYHESGFGTIDLFIAEGAADWIARERPPGPIAHSMVLGGYVSWRLHPEYQSMIDGRIEIWGPERVAQLELRGPAAFKRLDEEYEFGSVILTSSFDSLPLIAWFQANPEWRLVHAEIPAVLFVRDDPDREFPWPVLDVQSPDFLPEPTFALPILQDAHATARLRLLSALRPPDPRRRPTQRRGRPGPALENP